MARARQYSNAAMTTSKQVLSLFIFTYCFLFLTAAPSPSQSQALSCPSACVCSEINTKESTTSGKPSFPDSPETNGTLTRHHLQHERTNPNPGTKVICSKLNSLSSLKSDLAVSDGDSEIVHLEVSGSVFPRLDESQFGGKALSSVERLVLKNNQIEQISSNTFSSLVRLKLLDLSNNKLSTFGAASARGLLQLERIRLTGNPITCDCLLVPLLQLKKLLNLKIQGQCAEPPSLKNRPIAQLKAENLTCETLEEEHLSLEMKPSNNQIVFQGDPIKLWCKLTSLLEDVVLIWLFNGSSIPPEYSVNITSLSDRNLGSQTIESHLQIQHLDLAHSGSWTCEAVQGSVRSLLNRSVDVTVLSLVTPACSSDVTISNRGHYIWPRTMAGLKMSLPCQANVQSQASRFCNANGTWEEANTSACSFTSEVTKALEQFSKTNLTFSKTSALESARLLNAYLNDIAILEDPQDAAFVIETLKNYLDAAVRHPELLPLIMDVVSYLLRQQPLILEPSRSALLVLLQDVPSKTSEFKYQSSSLAVEKVKMKNQGALLFDWSLVSQNSTSPSLYKPNPKFLPQSVLAKSLLQLSYNTVNQSQIQLSDTVQAAVQLPPPAEKSSSSSSSSGSLVLSFISETNLLVASNSSVNLVSPVLGISSSTSDWSQPFRIILRLSELPENADLLRGAEWDYFRQQWIPSCSNTRVREGAGGFKSHVEFTCCCGSGLFAAVVPRELDPGVIGQNLKDMLDRVLSLPSPVYVGSAVCILCHVTAIVCYLTHYGKLQMTRPTKHSLLNTWLSLTVLVTLYTVCVKPWFARNLCQVVGLSLHYLTLSTLLWVMVGASGLYKHLTKASKSEVVSDNSSLAEEEPGEVPAKPALRFYLIGWGIPVIVVGIAGAIHVDQYASSTVCFLAKTPSLGAVGLPAAILVFLILTFHLLTWCFLRHLTSVHKQLQTAVYSGDHTATHAESTEPATAAAVESELMICVSQQNKNGYLPLLGGDNGSCPSNLTNLTHLTQGTEMTDLTSVSESQEPEGLSLVAQHCERGEAEGAMASSNEATSGRSDIERPLLMITPCSDDRIAESAKSVNDEGHSNPLMTSFTDDSDPPDRDQQTTQLLQRTTDTLQEPAQPPAENSGEFLQQQFLYLPDVENADEKPPLTQLRAQLTTLVLFCLLWVSALGVIVRPLKDLVPYDELLTSLFYALVSSSLGLHSLITHCFTRKDIRKQWSSHSQVAEAPLEVSATEAATTGEPPALLLTYATPVAKSPVETSLVETLPAPSNCDVASLAKTLNEDAEGLNVTVEPSAMVNSFYDPRQSKTARKFFQKQKLLHQTQNNQLGETSRERESHSLSVINFPQSNSPMCEDTLRNVSASSKAKVNNVNIHVDLGAYDWHELQNLVSNSETSWSKSEKKLPKISNDSKQGTAPSNLETETELHAQNTGTTRSDKAKRRRHHGQQRRRSKRSKWDEQFADKQPCVKPAYAFVNYDYRDKALAQVGLNEDVLRTLTAVQVKLKEDVDDSETVLKKETSV